MNASFTFFAFFTLYALVAFVSLVTFCTDNGAEVFGKVVCVCDYKLTCAVDFGLFNSYTVRTVKTVFTFVTLFAFCSLQTLLAFITFIAFCSLQALLAFIAFCADNRSYIGALTVRERKHKLTLRIDFGGRNAYAVFTVCAVHTVYTVGTYYFTEVCRRSVRI